MDDKTKRVGAAGTGESVPLDAGYTHQVGAVVSSLHALEMLLRWLMEDRLSPSEWGLATLKEGDYVRESAITSWAGLGTLVNAANARLEAVGSSAKIDPFVVTIRNALAHGRVLHRGDDDIPTLVKFGTPQAGRVKVESVVVLSADNLNAWTKTIEDETMKVSGMVSAILEARNRLNGLP